MGKSVGIDLGTLYSCISFANEKGELIVVRNQEGTNTTPSVVFFDTDGSTAVVGESARPSAAFAPDNLVECIKSQMGTNDYMVNIMGNDYSPTVISSIILRKLKEDAETYMGEPIEGCVITCPAYFGTIAKAATLEAAKVADLNVCSIVDEPTAAAVAYTYIRHIDTDKTILIYDLGGTFNCTLLKINFVDGQQKVDVVASNGDPFLGGKDWDDALIKYVVDEFCRATGADPDEMRLDPECWANLSIDAERNKKRLTSKESVKMKVEFNGEKQLIEITRDTFDSITEHLLQKTISLANEMFAKENRSIDEVDEIILVGGSTYMPQVAKRVKSEYNKVIYTYEHDTIIAMGAALIANEFTDKDHFKNNAANSNSPFRLDYSRGLFLEIGHQHSIINIACRGALIQGEKSSEGIIDLRYRKNDKNVIELTLAQNRASSEEATEEDLNGLYADICFSVDNEWLDEDPLKIILDFKRFTPHYDEEWIHVKNVRLNKAKSLRVQWKKRAFIGLKNQWQKRFNFDY